MQKSIYNQALVKTVNTGATTLAALTDVDTSGAQNNEVLTYNSGTNKWESSIAQGKNRLDQLEDTSCTNPITDSVLLFDGEYWIDKSHVLTSINDVQIDDLSLADKQILKYDNTSGLWKNSSDYLESVNIGTQSNVLNITSSTTANPRTTSINYQFSAVNNHQFLAGSLSNNGILEKRNIDKTDLPSLALNDLSNVYVNNPLNKEYLTYDSNAQKFINSFLYGYKYYQLLVNETISAVGDTIYFGANSTINLQNGGYIGERLYISATSGGSLTISVPNGMDFSGNAGPFNVTVGPYSSVELEWNNFWKAMTCCGIVVSDFGKRYDSNKLIISPQNNQLLKYNSTSQAFENTTYNLDDINNVSASTPSTGDLLQWDGNNWVNATLDRCHATCELYVVGSNLLTLTNQNQWYIFPFASTIVRNPSATSIFAINGSSYSLLYTGSNNKFYHTAFSISSSTNAANDSYELAYFINNNLLAKSVYSIDYANTGTSHSTALHVVLELNTNDVIDVRMRNISAAGKVITTNNINIVLMACCSTA